MQLDDEVCLCFHVTKRKVLSFLRIEKPRRSGQLSECFGAGTGCGWCRAYLRRLFDEAAAGRLSSGEPRASATQTSEPRGDGTQTGEPQQGSDPSAVEYAAARGSYIRAGGGTPPPGATPPPAGTAPAADTPS